MTTLAPDPDVNDSPVNSSNELGGGPKQLSGSSNEPGCLIHEDSPSVLTSGSRKTSPETEINPPTNTPTYKAEDLYFRALDYLAEGHPITAATLLSEALTLTPNFLDAHHALTRALQDSGQLDEALNAANQLIALDPEDVLAHTRLSILYQAKGMVPEAEAEATKAKLLGWKQQLRESSTAKSSNQT